MVAFDALMFEALDDTIRRMLGERTSELIRSLAEKKHFTKLEKTRDNVNAVILCLEKLVGKEGTQIIQTVSLKRLCHKLKKEYEEVEKHFLFLDELYRMKFKLASQITNEKNSAFN